MNTQNSLSAEPSFKIQYEKVLAKTGKVPLSDADVMILACEEISRTFTYHEKGYGASSQNDAV